MRRWFKSALFFAGGHAPKLLLNDPGLFYTADAMTIQVAVLCDAATEYNGKLNLLGTFDTVYAAQMPAHHPQCSVATRIAFERNE
jgi:hypothetical protein